MSLKDFTNDIIVLFKEKTSRKTLDDLKEYKLMTKSELIENIIYFSILAYILNLLPSIINPFGIFFILMSIIPLAISLLLGIWVLQQVSLEKEWAIHLVGICAILAILSNVGFLFSLYGLIRIPALVCYGIIALLYAYIVSNKLA